MSSLCRYLVCYIQGSTTSLIFCLLYFWQYCLYISSAIFITVLALCFLHYIHNIPAPIFRALYPWLRHFIHVQVATSWWRLGMVGDKRVLRAVFNIRMEQNVSWSSLCICFRGFSYGEKSSWQSESVSYVRSYLIKEFYWKTKICFYENKLSKLKGIFLL